MVSRSRGTPPLIPESQSALYAVEQLGLSLATRGRQIAANPVFLHSSSRATLAQLVHLLIQGLKCCAPSAVVTVLPAADLITLLIGASPVRGRSSVEGQVAVAGDMWVVQDIDRLPICDAQALAEFVDACLAHDVPVVLTSAVEPRDLDLPARLVSRLTGGLVVQAGQSTRTTRARRAAKRSPARTASRRS